MSDQSSAESKGTAPKPESAAPDASLKASLVTALLSSGDNWVKLATLALIGLSGFGNWIATWNSSDRNKQEIEVSRRVAWESNERVREEVIKQVADIHEWMKEATDEFHQGNKDSAQNKKILDGFKEELGGFEARQLAALNNQNSIMANQTKILNDLQTFVKERQKQ